jgi:hypothetical protein
VTNEQLEPPFLVSNEYFDRHGRPGRSWVESICRDLLQRALDEPEVQHWLAILAAGTTPQDAANAFAFSQERKADRVRFDFRTYLGRDASGQEVVDRVDGFLHGLTNEDLVAGFIGMGTEYYSRTDKGRVNPARWTAWAYRDVLFRDPGVDEVNGWLRFLG